MTIRKLAATVALAVALVVGGFALSSCTTIGNLTGNEQAATYDEKALLSAELAYSFALDSIQAAINAGAVTPERAQRILPLLQAAKGYLDEARRLYAAGQRLDASAATGSAIATLSTLTELLVEYGIIRRN